MVIIRAIIDKITDSETLAQQHGKIATDVEKQRTSIVRATVVLQESIQRQEGIQESCQEQQLLLERDIAEFTEALEQVNDGIVSIEGSIATCEEDFANATAQTSGLFNQVQISQRDIEQLVAQGQLKTATLHEQIANTENDVENTLLTLKVRSQRVDDLRASLAKLQEETATLIYQGFEKPGYVYGIGRSVSDLLGIYRLENKLVSGTGTFSFKNVEGLARAPKSVKDML